MNRPARPEVLAPAGDPDALRAAIQAGADAVYFGLQGFCLLYTSDAADE